MIIKIIEYILMFFGLVTGIDWFWDALNITTPEKVWAISAATTFLVIMMALSFCGMRHQVLMDRIEKCAKAKAKLEKTRVKCRLSSR